MNPEFGHIALAKRCDQFERLAWNGNSGVFIIHRKILIIFKNKLEFEKNILTNFKKSNRFSKKNLELFKIFYFQSMVDICGFLARTGMSGVELQKKLDVSSGLLSNYKAGKANPSYSMLCKLLDEGMTIEEMFGRKAWESVKQQAALESTGLNLSDEDCRKIVEHGLAMLQRK